MRTTRAAAGLVALALTLLACTPLEPDGERSTSAPTPTPTPEVAVAAEVRLPDAATTVLDSPDPVARAVAVSEALFASAPVVVLAPADDVAAQVRAAALAVSLGAPLLLAGPDDTVGGEVERLDAAAVLAVGVPGGLETDADVVDAPEDPEALAAVLRLDPLAAPVTAPGGEVAAVAALDASTLPAAPSDADDAGGATTEPEEPDEGALPLTSRPEPPSGGLVLTTGDAGDVAAVATARAAGVPVLAVPGGDPRVGSATVQAVAAAAPTAVVALGAAFGTPEDLGWRVTTAATGVELPGGGQTLFPGRRLVALYGTPTFPALGVLGETDLAGSIAKAHALAGSYQPLTGDLVVPAFEIIVTIASAGAGADGNYSNELPVESFVPWVEAARDAGIYVVLDLQPGRTDFLSQATIYEPLLRYPNVGLALDPEWRLAPDQVHLRQIGSVHASEINAVSTWLADLTRTHALPQKLFVLHQFSHRMIADRALVDTSRPELATMIHVDGQGSQGAKAGTWASLLQGAPPGLAWGWKNFIDEDVPMLTPPETYAVQPVPELVTYQ
ncbi:hypothetical protein [Actinotalea solisilvae]|uniref:hypothetical protein n=1 Tax=Actinotalea solisilvae TaxID=2072922 RepID=UPI0018F1CDC7|nr:hypothetical protein [Actinotalea solisilvae]